MRIGITIFFAGLLALSAFAQQNSTQSAAPTSAQSATHAKVELGQTGDPARNREEVVALLHEFLRRVDDPAMHDRFWSEQLVYTSGKGERRTKADIMQSMRSAKPDANAPKVTYAAEDVTVQDNQYAIVVNFRLVQMTDGKKTAELRNTGVFMRTVDKGRVTGTSLPTHWQVVAWQATPITAAKQ